MRVDVDGCPGSFIHAALDRFLAEHKTDLPPDPEARLLEIGREMIAQSLDRPGVWAFWWPRFQRIARWFVDVERNRRAGLKQTISEATGTFLLDGPAGPFTLTAQADRIDTLADGTIAIGDYKTGAPPSKSEVAAGFAPQLPLEGVIAGAANNAETLVARARALPPMQGCDLAGSVSTAR